MKKDGILNSALSGEIARLGHFHTFMIADMGFPIPAGVRVIDLALTRGIPNVRQVLTAVLQEVVVQEVILMDSVKEANPKLDEDVTALLNKQEIRYVSMDELRKEAASCNFVIRTAEDAPCSNMIFVSASGVLSRVEQYRIDP